eukprot:CAMPEP_0181467208 /NCGR_PEP_ID=MMETSP1110-20121109/36858_1 /TAXON_ID=174948 /ORGANISM="Symbiodinium sp., Strain CCMP421" /LENGTH=151 /DNA_ID=CAMNT_0023592023 /DNA_START=592 /DNA_END=1047 /DNA_ORIENTATION=-
MWGEVRSLSKLHGTVSTEVEQCSIDVDTEQAQQEEESHWSCYLPPDEQREGAEHHGRHASGDGSQTVLIQQESADNQAESQHADHQRKGAKHTMLPEDPRKPAPGPAEFPFLAHEVSQCRPQHHKNQRCGKAIRRSRTHHRTCPALIPSQV